jgi:hypothetical protein
VQYEIHGLMGEITHCHCPSCQKAHASAFSSVSIVQPDDLIFTAGETLLSNYESSAGKKRYFCSNCGSQIYAKREDQDHYIFHMGTIDCDPGVRPTRHIFTRYKAPWFNIHDDIPEYPEWAPQAQQDSDKTPAGLEHLYKTMSATLILAARKGTSTSLLLLTINSSEAEVVSENLSAVLKHEIALNVRDSDIMEALGENAFAVLLPYTDARAALIMAERIHNTAKTITHRPFINIGAATLRADQLDNMNLTANINDIMTIAKLACQASKNRDSNKAIHFDDL